MEKFIEQGGESWKPYLSSLLCFFFSVVAASIGRGVVVRNHNGSYG
jgi:hypothetical protein